MDFDTSSVNDRPSTAYNGQMHKMCSAAAYFTIT